MYVIFDNFEKCLVLIYVLYRVKWLDGYFKYDDLFYILVVINEKWLRIQDRWFISSLIGVNKLNDIMKKMLKNVGLLDNKRIINISVWKMLV